MYITANDKFYKITTSGKNKFYYYLILSEYSSLTDMEIYEPVLSETNYTFELDKVNEKNPVLPQLYTLVATEIGGTLIGNN
jgi:hypothetical protein